MAWGNIPGHTCQHCQRANTTVSPVAGCSGLHLNCKKLPHNINFSQENLTEHEQRETLSKRTRHSFSIFPIFFVCRSLLWCPFELPYLVRGSQTICTVSSISPHLSRPVNTTTRPHWLQTYYSKWSNVQGLAYVRKGADAARAANCVLYSLKQQNKECVFLVWLEWCDLRWQWALTR